MHSLLPNGPLQQRPTESLAEIRDRRRVIWMALGLFLLFSLLIVRFYHLQVMEHEKWERRAIAQHEGRLKDRAPRGTFWSNVTLKEGHPQIPLPFVVDVPKFHLHADPKSLPPKLHEEITAQIVALTGDPSQSIFIREELKRESRNRQLVRWLDRTKKEELWAWWIPYAKRHHLPRNALFFGKDYQRSYPFGKLLGQVLHTIRDFKESETAQGVPTGGLEAYFNDLLSGQDGLRLIIRSPRQRLESGQVLQEPISGADITLTVNHYLQAIAEEELEAGVMRTEAKGGFAIVMDPSNGEILALAQYPFFWPEKYREYFNDPDLTPHTTCQAISYAYEPGSVIKPLVMALCLTANEELKARGEPPLFDPEEALGTRDGNFAGRPKPLRDLRTHNRLNLDMAIQKSSNIYMARVVERLVHRLGAEWLRTALTERLQFGQKTGIELPGESSGFVPRLGRTYPNGALEWSAATPYSLAMGYNLQINAVQLLRAYAIVANGGYLVQPTLIRRIETQLGAVDTTNKNKEDKKQVLSEEACRRIVHALKFTTKSGGSGVRGDVPGFTEAGKTGTSEKLVNGHYAPDLHFSSFIGLVPAENPRLVVLVTIDEPKKRSIPGFHTAHLGGQSAAPVFREIARRSLSYLGATPDDPYGYPVGDPRRDATLADWQPQAKELQQLYEEWNSR